MIPPVLQELAHAAGLSLRWRDYRGQEREVSPDSLRRILAALELPADSEEQARDSRRRLEEEAAAPGLLVFNAGTPQPLPLSGRSARLLDEHGTPSELELDRDGHGQLICPPLPPGYYELETQGQRLQLAAAPARCFSVAEAAGDKRRLWGLAAQIYSLRSHGDGGIGNFTGLSQLARAAASRGADALAISPVHALFAGDVRHYSPYAPSSRLFLNALHADPVPDFGAARLKAIAERLSLHEVLGQFEDAPLIDWPEAATAKLAILRALHAEVADSLAKGRTRLGRDYRGFLSAGGERLREHAAFEALHGEVLARNPAQWHWRDWPEPLRRPGPAVAAYAAEHPQDVGFHLFLQWLAERGLAAAQVTAREAGMRIGIIADLAVGTAAGGSRAWGHPEEMLGGLSIGAPPDLLNRHGQNWGLTAFSPRALRRDAFQPYLDTLRASLRHAGGLRIDHVMSLSRLWLIPEGAGAEDGAYLSYPLPEMLRLLTLESHRHRAVIVGEDLGTVPEGFRAQLAQAGVLGMQVLWFERDHGYFVEPARWRADAMATTTTHDLPSVAGWWRERDLDWHAELKLFSQGGEPAEREERGRDRHALWDALVHAGTAAGEMPPCEQPERAVDAALDFVARTPSPLMLAPLEDVLGTGEQPNIPGTVDQHPNWRRRWPYDADSLLGGTEARRRLDSSMPRAEIAEQGAEHQAGPGPPRATLRLQFNRDFTFEHALEQLPYFARLGVSHLYASPILTARAGSAHGYDVVDPSAVNPELGGEDGLRRLVAGLRHHRLGLIVDIVPNHMAVGNHDNAWWQDVLQWGRNSRYASFFDIDWDVPDPALSGRLLAPFLGQSYGDALAAGEIVLRFDADSGRFYAAYYDHHFPIRPENYAGLLAAAGAALADQAARFAGFRGGRGARREDFSAACAALAAAAREPAAAAALQAVLELHTGGEGYRRLHRLLEQQHYRLAWWRAAVDEINWRRFFDVIDLAGLRVQEHRVFEAVHATSLRLYAEGLVDGFRVDHVDGLADPRQYCRRLRQRLRKLASLRPPGLNGRPYLIVEKILAPGEVLALDWQVDGSSGYAFMNESGALLHDARGEAELREIWSGHSGRSGDFEQEERSARRRIARELLAADFNACAHALHQLARRQPASRDWSLEAVKRVLTEMLVRFPVYRCYADARGRTPADAHIMAAVCEAARAGCLPGEAPLVDLVDGWLGGLAPLAAPAAERRDRLRALARFQQLTSPLAAKAVEDTAFYRHGTLLSRNEVGADPAQFALDPQGFHAACASRLRRHPAAMLATATHDHKRGEDLRARLAVLSEMPQRWGEAVARWREAAAPLKPEAGGMRGPDATDEYMLYQMVVGAWPFGLRWDDAAGLGQLRLRLAGWQQKAVREAKRRSGWVEPNLAYEEACDEFLRRLLDPQAAAALLRDLAGFVQVLETPGALNGLAQTLLRLTTPGVPDLYQGCEWWDLSLVDPDNRRPVDYAARAAALERRAQPDFAGTWRDGRVKQALIAALLDFRAAQPRLFAEGRYLPLAVEGPAAEHLLAFARVLDGREALVVLAPRLPLRLLQGRDSLLVPAERWRGCRVVLPPALAYLRFEHVLGDGRLAAERGGINVEQALEEAPLAALAGRL